MRTPFHLRTKDRMTFLLLPCLLLLLGMAPSAAAAGAAITQAYNDAQYHDTMAATRDLVIDFTKDDGSKISWDNPLLETDDTTFGFSAEFDLTNVSQIIDSVAGGSISNMPSGISSFVSQLAPLAEVSGEIDLSIDLNSGLGTYFTVNQTELQALEADPTSLLNGNSAFLSTFNVDSVAMSGNTINIVLTMKDGVTGQNILDLKNSYNSVTLSAANLFTLNSSLWGEINNINKGEFDQLIEISSPSMIFVINIPGSLTGLAGMLGQHNPFVGIQLTINPGYGQINLGFTVSYDGNGNTAGTTSEDVNSPYNINNSTVTVLGKGSLERSGYIFTGWNTAADGSGTNYLPGATFQADKSIVLYAQWVAAYNVRYDGNGNTAGTAPTDENSPYVANSTVTVLDKGSLGRNGYTFTGWNTAADGSGIAYAAAAFFSIDKETTLYAQWKAITYTVTFDSQGGSAISPVAGVAYGAFVAKPTDPTYTGFTFGGWYTDTAYTTAWDFSGNTVTDNITLYAKWTAVATVTTTTTTTKVASSVPNTGDDNNLPFWLTMMVAFGAVVIWGTYYNVKSPK